MNVLDVVISLPATANDLAEDLKGEAALRPEVLPGAGFDGGGELLTLVLSVSSATVAPLVAILRARWQRVKSITIEVDGMKVTAPEPEQIERILQQMLAARAADNK